LFGVHFLLKLSSIHVGRLSSMMNTFIHIGWVAR
jgi:hypothetical protein